LLCSDSGEEEERRGEEEGRGGERRREDAWRSPLSLSLSLSFSGNQEDTGLIFCEHEAAHKRRLIFPPLSLPPSLSMRCNCAAGTVGVREGRGEREDRQEDVSVLSQLTDTKKSSGIRNTKKD